MQMLFDVNSLNRYVHCTMSNFHSNSSHSHPGNTPANLSPTPAANSPDVRVSSTIQKLFLSWFGLGYVPFMPGTVGSIGAIPLCWFLISYSTPLFRFVFAIGMTCLAILASAQDQKNSEVKDPQHIVIDEVVGMLWSTVLLGASLLSLCVAFGLFRLFDISKPFPARFFDRQSKLSPSSFYRGLCIVFDDVVAGLYVALIVQVAVLYHVLY